MRGVFAVPPLARQHTSGAPIDFAESRKLVDHIVGGGVTRLLYGGNAFLYHITLAEYEQLLGWLAEQPLDEPEQRDDDHPVLGRVGLARVGRCVVGLACRVLLESGRGAEEKCPEHREGYRPDHT